MRNNANDFPLPNHVTPAAFFAALRAAANYNGLHPVPVNSNLNLSNHGTPVVNNNLSVPAPDVSAPPPNASVVISSNTPDVSSTLLGDGAQHIPTE